MYIEGAWAPLVRDHAQKELPPTPKVNEDRVVQPRSYKAITMYLVSMLWVLYED